jgi:hypothetical protein
MYGRNLHWCYRRDQCGSVLERDVCFGRTAVAPPFIIRTMQLLDGQSKPTTSSTTWWELHEYMQILTEIGQVKVENRLSKFASSATAPRQVVHNRTAEQLVSITLQVSNAHTMHPSYMIVVMWLHSWCGYSGGTNSTSQKRTSRH